MFGIPCSTVSETGVSSAGARWSRRVTICFNNNSKRGFRTKIQEPYQEKTHRQQLFKTIRTDRQTMKKTIMCKTIKS